MFAKQFFLMIMKLQFILIIMFAINVFGQDSLVTTYFNNGSKKEEYHLNKNIREGEDTLYFENGKVSEERYYVNGKIDGLVKIYSEQGKLQKTIYIEEGRRNGPTSLFTKEGVYEKDVTYDNGKKVPDVDPYEELEKQLASKSKERSKQKENIIAAKVEKKIDGSLPPKLEEDVAADDPAFFLSVEVMPEPVGGIEAIKKKIVYPKRAIENNIEGTVKIRAFIDEYGEVTEASVAEGIGYGCDEAARTAVYYSKFKPGLQKGKRVNVQIVIPIEFKLPRKEE